MTTEAPSRQVGMWYSTWYTNARPYIWQVGHGVGSARQLLGDVNGDGRADSVIYIAQTGEWWVALAKTTGDGFGPPSQWQIGHGVGSANQLLGDVNGDGRADSVIYIAQTGEWWVALAKTIGDGFGPPSQWQIGHGVGSANQLLGDVNGDGRADSIVYFTGRGEWWVALAKTTGDGFGSYGTAPRWIEHGTLRDTVSSARMLADTDGDGFDDAVAFVAGDGRWLVMPGSEPYDKPNKMNFWDAYNIRYRPLVSGVPSTYDSGDPTVIDEHLAMIAAAGVDYLLLDESNGLHVDANYILQRAQAVCRRLALFDQITGSRLRLAIAIGGVQYDHRPQTVEAEAADVLALFANDATCGPYYQTEGGKPLLALYAERADRQAWLDYPSKSASNSFTVRYVQGRLPGVDGVSYPSSSAQGCGTPPPSATPPAAEIGDYLGWGTPYGAVGNGDHAVVMPGWDNHRGERVERTQLGQSAGFYRDCAWSKVLSRATLPGAVIVNSFNEYAEETAVAPTDTSAFGARQWSSPYLYWTLTRDFINQYKPQTTLPCVAPLGTCQPH